MEPRYTHTQHKHTVLEPNKPTLEQLGRRWWRENRKRLLLDAVPVPNLTDLIVLAFLAGAEAGLQQATEILSEQDYKDVLAGDDAARLELELEEG